MDLRMSRTNAKYAELQAIGTNIWTVSHQLRLLGMPLLTRMVICRLSGKRLWVSSPVPVDESVKEQIEALGEVAYVVAPNSFHHLYLQPFRLSFPWARYYSVPNLQHNVKHFVFDESLSEQPVAAWQGEMEHRLILGSKFFHEALFLHRSSRTLIVTDMLINMTKTKSRLANFALTLYGVMGKPASSPLCKRLIHNRSQARTVMEAVMAWDFERIVMAHGKIIDTDAKAIFRRALSWL